MRRDWVWVNTSYNPRIDVCSQQLDIALPVHFWDVNHWVLGNSFPYSKRHSKTYPKHRWLPRSRTDVVARHRRSGAIRSAAGAFSAEEQGLVVFPWVDQFTAGDQSFRLRSTWTHGQKQSRWGSDQKDAIFANWQHMFGHK
jgi:hypothetical protein